MVNIECKTPREVSLRPNYDSERLIKLLSAKLQENFGVTTDMLANQMCCISSFDHEFIQRYRTFENALEQKDRIPCLYLHTRKIEDILPGEDVTQHWDIGCNI